MRADMMIRTNKQTRKSDRREKKEAISNLNGLWYLQREHHTCCNPSFQHISRTLPHAILNEYFFPLFKQHHLIICVRVSAHWGTSFLANFHVAGGIFALDYLTG
jgi:hypothetical protein